MPPAAIMVVLPMPALYRLVPASILYSLLAVVCPLAATPHISLDEAIQQALERNHGVRIARALVEREKGNLQAETGRFDWLLSGSLRRESVKAPVPGAGPGVRRLEQESYTLSAIRQFRSGMALGPDVSVSRTDGPGAGGGPLGVSSAGAVWIIPLARDLGAANTAAGERAARAGLEGAQGLQEWEVSGQVASAALRFYGCLEARERLEILLESERLTLEAMGVVRRMVTAAMLDPADSLQAQAVVEGKKAERRAGEQGLYRERIALARSMGYAARELPDAPLAAGAFALPMDAGALRSVERRAYIRLALERRGDYRSTLKGVEAAEALLRRAENGRKPRLDLNLGLHYAGRSAAQGVFRRLEPVYSDLEGPNLTAELYWELPVENRAAKGGVAAGRAALSEARHRSRQAEARVGAEVLESFEDLLSAVEQYRAVLAGEQTFRSALEHEGKKLKTGQSSITDLLQVQDRYTDIRLARIRALRDYAAAMVLFRQATGTLLTARGGRFLFDTADLTAFPAAGGQE